MNGTAMKKFIKETASLVIHFAHGGLLAAGFLVAIFGVMIVNSAQGHQRGLLPVGGSLGKTAAPVLISEEMTLPAADVRPTVEYLSRKYRVAAAAIEPLVLTAREAGEKTGLDPMLLVAVMAIESGFNPIAESQMGAQGLMQVIPRFHQDKLKHDAVPGNDLLDPSVNIHVGALVLKEYIRRTGSLEAGLQQYAGAVGDVDGGYAAKVLAEKQRIESAVRRSVQNNA